MVKFSNAVWFFFGFLSNTMMSLLIALVLINFGARVDYFLITTLLFLLGLVYVGKKVSEIIKKVEVKKK